MEVSNEEGDDKTSGQRPFKVTFSSQLYRADQQGPARTRSALFSVVAGCVVNEALGCCPTMYQ